MDDPNSSGIGHSPRVRLWLESAGRVITLSQVAPDWVIPASPIQLPPGRGVVVSELDGRAYRRHVTLPEGMSAPVAKTPVVELSVHDAASSAG